MQQQRQEEVEYDVYYRGTKEELFAFLYPLTGPDSSLFDHLQTVATSYDTSNKQFQVRYLPKDFTNIDKQKEEIIYKSSKLPTQSNYFYSVYQPDYNCFVWQNIDNFMEMRPQSKIVQNHQEQKKEQKKEEQKTAKIDLPENKVREMLDDVVTTPLKQNWEVSKDEYLIHLAK